MNSDNITNAIHGKPTPSQLINFLNKAEGLSSRYKYFYIQCMEDISYSSEQGYWDWGLTSGKIKNEYNMKLAPLNEVMNFKEQDYQNLIDEVLNNYIKDQKMIQMKNKLKKINEDF